MKCILPVKKNAKYCWLHFTKFQFLEKLTSSVHLGFSILIAWISGIILKTFQKIHQKMKSTNFNLSSKILGYEAKTQEKKKEVKIVLSYGLQQNVSVELHMM